MAEDIYSVKPENDPTAILVTLICFAFIVVMMFFDTAYDKHIRETYKYTICKQEYDNNEDIYHTNEYKIDKDGCIHFVEYDSITLCGDYKIINN